MRKAANFSLIFAIATLSFLTSRNLRAQASCFDHAMQLFQQRQWKYAAAEFDRCEREEPGKTASLLYRGKSLVNLGELEEAATALTTYRQTHSHSEDAAYLLAFTRFRQNKPQASLQLYNDAVKLKGPTADDLKIVALDYVLLNDYNDAARYLEKALAMDPANIEAYYHLGRVRYQQNQFDLAIAAFRQVLQRDPANVKAEDNLGLSLEAKNEIDAAIAAYRKAIHLDENASAHNEQPYLNLGTLLAKSNRTKDAVPLLVRATAIDAKNAKAHYQLAKAYFDVERFDDALPEAERAINLDAGNSANHYLLGRIYQRTGKINLADDQFRLTEELIRKNRSEAGSGMASGIGPN
jgi:tetratricopeptide (TPR) repeat protein